jgi:hypothetical protein
MRYALALGLGRDPTDAAQLRFVNDVPAAPLALPTMAVVLGFPGSWMQDPATGIDFTQIVHGEEQVVWHRPLPPAGTVRARHRVTRIVDKGPGRGATITYDKDPARRRQRCVARDRDPHHLRARQRRFRDVAGPGRCPAGAARAGAHRRARSHARHPDAAAAGLALPPVRRSQPAAFRSADRAGGGLRAADPARPVHLGHRCPCAAGAVRRQRAGAAAQPVCALSRRRCFPARRCGSRLFGDGGDMRFRVRVPCSATGSCSTTAMRVFRLRFEPSISITRRRHDDADL